MATNTTVEVDADLQELIPNFLTNRNKETIELERALQKGDFDALRIIGHNMKGVGGGYGFNHITELGIEIEMAAKAQDSKTINDCLKRYRDYLEGVTIVYV